MAILKHQPKATKTVEATPLRSVPHLDRSPNPQCTTPEWTI